METVAHTTVPRVELSLNRSVTTHCSTVSFSECNCRDSSTRTTVPGVGLWLNNCVRSRHSIKANFQYKTPWLYLILAIRETKDHKDNTCIPMTPIVRSIGSSSYNIGTFIATQLRYHVRKSLSFVKYSDISSVRKRCSSFNITIFYLRSIRNHYSPRFLTLPYCRKTN